MEKTGLKKWSYWNMKKEKKLQSPKLTGAQGTENCGLCTKPLKKGEIIVKVSATNQMCVDCGKKVADNWNKKGKG